MTRAKRTLAIAVVATVWAIVALPLVAPGLGCPTARITGHPCPGCGTTRALALLLHGDLSGSLAMHPLAVPTVLAEAAFAFATLVLAWRRGAPWAAFEERAGRITLYVLMGVLTLDFALWIARGAGALGGPVPI